MFCPNCGKPIKENDNFCRYCGADLRIEDTSSERTESYIETEHFEEQPDVVEEKIDEDTQIEQEEQEDADLPEELVFYDVKKHWISLFWPAFLTPVFFVYFWNIFLNTHSLFSWVVVIAMLAGIICPILCFKNDKMVITNKFAHISLGLKKEEIDIPLDKFEIFNVTQSSMGKVFDYCVISFFLNSQKYEYKYVESPEYLNHIFENPKEFIKENI